MTKMVIDLLRFIRSEDYQKINIELYPLGYETELFKDIILNNSLIASITLLQESTLVRI